MGAENRLDLWRQRSKPLDRSAIGFEIGFGTEEPDGSRIVGVAGEEQAIGAIKKRDGVRSVAGRGDDLNRPPAQIDVDLRRAYRL